MYEQRAEPYKPWLKHVVTNVGSSGGGMDIMAIGVSYDFHTFTWATKSESTQWWNNMAVVVIFGLSFATILTLVVVPSLYVMLYRLTIRLGFKGVEAQPAQAGPVTA